MLRDAVRGAFGSAYAWAYDRFLETAEVRGLSELRRELLAEASGRALEIGAGTGINVEHYPAAVTELVLLEPDERMAARIGARARGRAVEVVTGSGEHLPFADASFDTVTATLVLCAVPDVDRVLAEVARVLRPGGRFLFLEHVRAADPGLARWQDRLDRPWGVVGRCHPNRDTLAALGRSPLRLERHEGGSVPGAIALVRPMLRGVARAG